MRRDAARLWFASPARPADPSMVWALAQQRDWLAAHADPFVAQALIRATADEQDVIDCVGEPTLPERASCGSCWVCARDLMPMGCRPPLATRIAEQIATDGEAACPHRRSVVHGSPRPAYGDGHRLSAVAAAGTFDRSALPVSPSTFCQYWNAL